MEQREHWESYQGLAALGQCPRPTLALFGYFPMQCLEWSLGSLSLMGLGGWFETVDPPGGDEIRQGLLLIGP
jgi:hypothetical protein